MRDELPGVIEKVNLHKHGRAWRRRYLCDLVASCPAKRRACGEHMFHNLRGVASVGDVEKRHVTIRELLTGHQVALGNDGQRWRRRAVAG